METLGILPALPPAPWDALSPAVRNALLGQKGGSQAALNGNSLNCSQFSVIGDICGGHSCLSQPLLHAGFDLCPSAGETKCCCHVQFLQGVAWP